MKWLIGLVLAAVLGVAGYVRLAPEVVADWHQPITELAGEAGATAPVVVTLERGAAAFVPAADVQAAFARLVVVALASPRVRVVAGSAEEGRMTFVARSALWGFPDYITVEATPKGLRLWSRQRFGPGDYGVNAARLADWVARL